MANEVKFGNQNVDYLFCALVLRQDFFMESFLLVNYHSFLFQQYLLKVHCGLGFGDTEINFRK